MKLKVWIFRFLLNEIYCKKELRILYFSSSRLDFLILYRKPLRSNDKFEGGKGGGALPPQISTVSSPQVVVL